MTSEAFECPRCKTAMVLIYVLAFCPACDPEKIKVARETAPPESEWGKIPGPGYREGETFTMCSSCGVQYEFGSGHRCVKP